jgi:hypothetical protein
MAAHNNGSSAQPLQQCGAFPFFKALLTELADEWGGEVRAWEEWEVCGAIKTRITTAITIFCQNGAGGDVGQRETNLGAAWRVQPGFRLHPK